MYIYSKALYISEIKIIDKLEDKNTWVGKIMFFDKVLVVYLLIFRTFSYSFLE